MMSNKSGNTVIVVLAIFRLTPVTSNEEEGSERQKEKRECYADRSRKMYTVKSAMSKCHNTDRNTPALIQSHVIKGHKVAVRASAFD